MAPPLRPPRRPTPAGVWSFTPTGLVDGQHTVVASETNAAGQTGSANLSFTLDTTSASGSTSTSGSTSASGSTGGDSSGGTTGTGTGAITGSASPPPAASGLPVVTAALVSDTGTSATDGITSNAALTGTADPNAAVNLTIDGTAAATSATADASGVWSFTPTGLVDGQHTVVASETNAAGQTGSANLSFTLDTKAAGADGDSGDVAGRHHNGGDEHVRHAAKHTHASAGELDTSLAQAPGHSNHLAGLMGQYMAAGFHDQQTGAGAIGSTFVPRGSPGDSAFLAAPLHHAA